MLRDRRFVMSLVRSDGKMLMLAGDGLRKDPEIVLTAIIQNPVAMFYADESLRENLDFVKAAIAIHGRALPQ